MRWFAALPSCPDLHEGEGIANRFRPAASGERSAVAELVTADPAARVLRGKGRKAEPVFY
jgi:hypothetical protein